MSFENAIECARKKFVQHGEFTLLSNESINEVVKREHVPDDPGVYMYFSRDDLKHPLYIGKAGTMRTDGTWMDQRLRKRLTRKQGGLYRKEYFRKLMAESKFAGLIFFWFVTHSQNGKVIPALAELELMQAHYDEFRCLPKLNKCV